MFSKCIITNIGNLAFTEPGRTWIPCLAPRFGTNPSQKLDAWQHRPCLWTCHSARMSGRHSPHKGRKIYMLNYLSISSVICGLWTTYQPIACNIPYICYRPSVASHGFPHTTGTRVGVQTLSLPPRIPQSRHRHCASHGRKMVYGWWKETIYMRDHGQTLQHTYMIAFNVIAGLGCDLAIIPHETLGCSNYNSTLSCSKPRHEPQLSHGFTKQIGAPCFRGGRIEPVMACSQLFAPCLGTIDLLPGSGTCGLDMS